MKTESPFERKIIHQPLLCRTNPDLKPATDHLYYSTNWICATTLMAKFICKARVRLAAYYNYGVPFFVPTENIMNRIKLHVLHGHLQ